jgi:integrase/recombinase XerD
MKPLAELLTHYLDYGRSLQGSRHTLRAIRYHVQAFLNWLETTHHLDRVGHLRPEHLEGWMKHLAGRHTHQGFPLKSRTINKLVENLRTFLKYLAERGWVASSLPRALGCVKEPQLLLTSVLNHSQVKRVLLAQPAVDAETWRNRVMLEVLYSTGIRVGELLALNVTDVDLDNATAVVLGKGNKQRVVPIGKTARRLLESYLKAVRPFLLSQADEPALFLNHAGQRMPYHTFRRIVHRSAEAAGLEINVTPHTFRRSCTTELIRGGANLYHVKELLGHENLETLKHYTKLTIEDLKATHARCHPRERAVEI